MKVPLCMYTPWTVFTGTSILVWQMAGAPASSNQKGSKENRLMCAGHGWLASRAISSTMCRARVASQPGHGESSSVYRIRL